MPKTKKQSLVFTVMMCAFMVFCMGLYNIILHGERSFSAAMTENLSGFLLGYVVGMICDWFLVSRPAKALAFKLIKPEDKPIKIALIISLFMVCGMVLCMSLFGAVVNVGFSAQLPAAYLTAIPKNFIMALPLQLLIAGPIVRFAFSKIFPAAEEKAEPTAEMLSE